jgi:hypothetical protein
MTSEKQRLANQRNAQKSTGPKTEAGKAAIAQNNLKHGLCSARTVLPLENSEEYAALLSDLRAAHEPANEQEDNMVRLIAHQYWRINRHFRVETGVYTSQEKLFRLHEGIEQDDQGDPDEMLGLVFWKQGEVFERIRRYETTIHNGYFKAVQRLEQTQALRRQREERQTRTTARLTPAPVEAAPTPEPAAVPVENPVQPSTETPIPAHATQSGTEPAICQNGFESQNSPMPERKPNPTPIRRYEIELLPLNNIRSA